MKILFLIVIVLLPVVFGVGVFFYLINNLSKKVRGKLNEIAFRMGGRLKKGIVRVGYVEGVYKTKQIKISYSWPVRDGISKLIIELFCSLPFRMEIKEKTAMNRFLRKIKLFRVIDTGILFYDEKFFVRSNNKMDCINYLSQSEIKTSIERIFNQQFFVLFLKDRIKLIKMCHLNKEERKRMQKEFLQKLSLKKLTVALDYTIEKSLNTDSVMNVLDNLCVLSGKFPCNSNKS